MQDTKTEVAATEKRAAKASDAIANIFICVAALSLGSIIGWKIVPHPAWVAIGSIILMLVFTIFRNILWSLTAIREELSKR